VFTCITIRALHVEAAHTLEVDSFIWAYQRFASRRRKPKKIYSDNGTNFTGAERELKEALQRLDQASIFDRPRKENVQWSFNPPEASHQGRIWERMIKLEKKTLGALLKEQMVNDETVDSAVRSGVTLDDRPITPLSDGLKDPVDIFTKEDIFGKGWHQATYIANLF